MVSFGAGCWPQKRVNVGGGGGGSFFGVRGGDGGWYGW
jgi:hypothetical protein